MKKQLKYFSVRKQEISLEVNFQTLYRWQYRKHSLRYAGYKNEQK